MTELFASALHLDRTAVKALKMTDTYSLHRVVYSLFSDERSDTEKNSNVQSGIVYADQGGDFQHRKVLIVSNRPPATNIDGKYGMVLIKPISDTFLSHTHYCFKVQVNPVRKDKKSGKRIAVKGRAAIADWFLKRATDSWGFQVTPQTLQIEAIDVLRFEGKSGRLVTIGKAHVQGQLTVINSQQFRNSFKNGIGKGRAFGCGLLQIVPIIDNLFT
ncbi:type I-E CRISPR-associated protein Cas6/Cse3/CasE [Candidatus Pantoea multigeneris]|uniref:Type I-E CRISPR-associated protein Cas6/Cse3/CasE n=1 Tax=Candidatus Pantoea multigeneris TaxID=2608357 RepID=A0ABX0RF80_9GAMM|nr:type I-E CRISPR-associated protein Cas6/Cse3/CasE [Pantoea multigeneris]NIF24015.1 type I-E CRISPR-associated protein Cas6/Cse3/CasE [Pantoea multigeneris]